MQSQALINESTAAVRRGQIHVQLSLKTGSECVGVPTQTRRGRLMIKIIMFDSSKDLLEVQPVNTGLTGVQELPPSFVDGPPDLTSDSGRRESTPEPPLQDSAAHI